MTIILPYNSTSITKVKLFLKNDAELAFYNFFVYKNGSQVASTSVNEYSSTDRFAVFKMTTKILIGTTEADNISISKEGWYDYIIYTSIDSENDTVLDEGQLFIGDPMSSNTDKVFYEKD